LSPRLARFPLPRPLVLFLCFLTPTFSLSYEGSGFFGRLVICLHFFFFFFSVFSFFGTLPSPERRGEKEMGAMSGMRKVNHSRFLAPRRLRGGLYGGLSIFSCCFCVFFFFFFFLFLSFFFFSFFLFVRGFCRTAQSFFSF